MYSNFGGHGLHDTAIESTIPIHVTDLCLHFSVFFTLYMCHGPLHRGKDTD